MGRRDSLNDRVSDLEEAAEFAQWRLDATLIDEALAVASRIDRRLAFSTNHTVVALAGATGSGKSSLFNAISGTRLAEPGMKRPTTSRAMAASWGSGGDVAGLLDWLDVPRRHQVKGDDVALDGLILMDLPDHDSTVVTHRLEVDRLLELVDMFIWVVDPQKYADAMLHDEYLKPMAAHAEVMLVVLNQIDRLTSDQACDAMADLRRLLDSEGLTKAKLLGVSALTGQGVEGLRKAISRAVQSKRSVAARLNADVHRVADRLNQAYGNAKVAEKVPEARARALNESLAQAAGLGLVREAVLRSMRHRGVSATGWPVLAWINRFRPDPLRMLRLDKGVTKADRAGEIAPVSVQRTSLPRRAQGVQDARVDTALRELAAVASQGLPQGWVDEIRAKSLTNRAVLADKLDTAVATADLAMDSGHNWWSAVRILQWVIFFTAAFGGLWLLIDALLAYMQLPHLPRILIGKVPLPTVLLIGGVIAGLATAGLARIGVEAGARAKALRAERVLTKAMAEVSDELVIAPINAELTRYHEGRSRVRRAAAG
ncbi:hypothetical protein HMPREF1531_00098 [Propionibacterium sp. oral taxon 192 str. F0372]|uniref:GTPase n=1 Tax=Propionibacterium sp. oral taxon 192 TaxID=671222 RepID=UPI0003532B6A|nr:GTPase [Propionibacterium sp. oral taxon 192]EPH07051.1 hypothetical protein HMPREF1531_00098 [Propionibacterium sp. oral taxon 192 str. F0372]